MTTTSATPRRQLKNPAYEAFIALLSILSIINMALVYMPWLDEQSRQVVNIFQLAITFIFLADFIYRLFSADTKSHYFFRDWGWADLLACIPFLRIFRVFRIVRVVRLMREIGPRVIIAQLLYDRAGSVLYLTIFFGLLIIQTASMTVLRAENANPDANIQTPSDAIWWSYVTITTVGYGDRFPTTTWGRIVGVLLMTSGVALFGVFTSFLANLFLAPKKKPEEEQATAPPESAAARLAGLRQLIEEQEKTNSALKERLDEMEKLIGA